MDVQIVGVPEKKFNIKEGDYFIISAKMTGKQLYQVKYKIGQSRPYVVERVTKEEVWQTYKTKEELIRCMQEKKDYCKIKHIPREDVEITKVYNVKGWDEFVG